MAEPTQTDLQFLSSDPEVLGLQRQRALANLLTGQAFNQPQGQMISGHYVKPSALQQALPMINAAIGGLTNANLDTKQTELAAALRGKQSEVMQAWQQAKTPQEKFAIGTSQYAPKELQAATYEMLKPQKLGEGETISQMNFGTGAYEPMAQGGAKVAPEVRQAMQLLGINKPLDQLNPQELKAVENKAIEFKKAGASNLSVNMPSAEERKAGFMANILDSNLAQMQKAYQLDPKSVKPNVPSSLVEAISGPNVLSRNLSSTQRQIVEDSQLDVLDAALTLRTGAAYTKEQLKGMKDTYFPRALDPQPVVDAKKARLESLLSGAYIASGRATPKRTSEAYTGATQPTMPTPTAAPVAQIDPKLLQFMTPEQKALFGVKQ
jgi:hypothetical protein